MDLKVGPHRSTMAKDFLQQNELPVEDLRRFKAKPQNIRDDDISYPNNSTRQNRFTRTSIVWTCRERVNTSSFIHSFIHSGYFYSISSSPLLLKGTPDTAQILCRNFKLKRHRQLRVKDLPKVPTWRL